MWPEKREALIGLGRGHMTLIWRLEVELHPNLWTDVGEGRAGGRDFPDPSPLGRWESVGEGTSVHLPQCKRDGCFGLRALILSSSHICGQIVVWQRELSLF